MLAFLLFILGVNVGSFLNVCIWRLPRHESVSHPPSHCPHCNTRLRPLDLVPLLSQFFLRGHCRYCGAKFSWRYFGIELLTGLLFALAGWNAGFLAEPSDLVHLGTILVFISTLVVISWVDFDTRYIQLESVFLLGLAGVAGEAWQLRQGVPPSDGGVFAGLLPAPLPGSLLAMVVMGAGFASLRSGFSVLYGREAMGFGDVLLVAAIAANLGWNPTLFTFLFLSTMIGLFGGVALQIPRALRTYRWAKRRHGLYGGPDRSKALVRHTLRHIMPFGPALACGGLIALLFGVQINEAYWNFANPPLPPATVLPFGMSSNFPSTP